MGGETIGEVCTFINGRTYKQEELLDQGKYRVLRVGNFFTNNNWYYSNLELETDKCAKKGDLLYAWSASFGPRFWFEEKVIYHYHIWKIDYLKNVSAVFLFYFLDRDAALLKDQIQGGTMAHITKGDMEKRGIAVPSLGEQERIAEVLGCWDEGIQRQAKMVELLTQRKRALMQQLLTAKKRLQNFSTPWQTTKLGDVLTKLSNGLTYDTELKEGIPVTRIETISTGKIDYNKIGLAADVNNLENYRLQKGDILFSHINSIAHIGKVALYDGAKELYHGMNLLLLRVGDIAKADYLYYFLCCTIANKAIKSMAKQAVNQSSINVKELSSWSFNLPPLEEQKAIAKVLTTADKEIDIATKQLAALRHQKRALMQQLLTGKKRLKF